MPPILRVQQLGKRYPIGRPARPDASLREQIGDLWRVPRRLWRRDGSLKGPSPTIWALRDVSFDVEPGEIVGIIGKNGAGKSTLLKILSRITAPTTGGADIYGRVGSLLEVGTGFHADLSGRENLYLNGSILGMRRREIDRKFEEIVEFAEIGPFIDTPVKHYSSGMYLRLAFAIAAHLEPEILIVDEVLAVGDFGFQKKCLGKMSDVAQQGRTILFVSHNLVALRSLCHRGILLDQGEVTASGSIDSVVQTYVQQFSTTRLEWVATGEDAITSPVQLLAVRLLTSPPVDPRRLTVADPFAIEVVYQSDLTDGLLQVSLVLENLEGVCVFNARSQPQRFASGQVRQRCQIPANLLNDDSYTLRVILIQDTNLGLLDRSNLLHFDIHDTERQGAWYGKWIGAVRPQFEWMEEVTSSVRGE